MTGSAELNATVARVATAILALLADRHEREDVIVTALRLAATEQVQEANGRYTLAVPEP
jgi:hypothetical protein